MELQEFIQTALVDIVAGVKGANKILDETKIEEGITYGLRPTSHKTIEEASVEFNVAVTTKESKKKKSEAKAKVYVIAGGVGREALSQRESVSRIRFRVSVQKWVGRPTQDRDQAERSGPEDPEPTSA